MTEPAVQAAGRRLSAGIEEIQSIKMNQRSMADLGYRVQPGEADTVSVRVHPQGPFFTGEVVEVSFDGVGACFPSSAFSTPDRPAPAMGQHVQLSLTLGEAPAVLRASGTVVLRTDRKDSVHYGFRFTDRKEVARQLSSKLVTLFNRRRRYRVSTDANSLVAVTVEGGQDGGKAQAHLVDISTTGVGLRLSKHFALGLVATDRIKVCISLPDCPDQLEVQGIIRHRHPVGAFGEEVDYGIKFAWEHSDNAAAQQREIGKFVMKQQRELLRRCVGRASLFRL